MLITKKKRIDKRKFTNQAFGLFAESSQMHDDHFLMNK